MIELNKKASVIIGAFLFLSTAKRSIEVYLYLQCKLNMNYTG